MANKDHPHGLFPVKMLNGGKIPMNKYSVATTSAIYQGDIVNLRGSGTVASNKTAEAAANTIGVAASYSAASGSVWVYDDPMTIFEIQSDGATDPGSTTAQAQIGRNAVVTTATGNTTTKISKVELDYSGITTATADPVKIIGFYQGVDNDKSLAHARYLVMLNAHMYKASAARATI